MAPATSFIQHLVKSEDLNHHRTLYAGRTAEWFVETGFVAAANLVEQLGRERHEAALAGAGLRVHHHEAGIDSFKARDRCSAVFHCMHIKALLLQFCRKSRDISMPAFDDQ